MLLDIDYIRVNKQWQSIQQNKSDLELSLPNTAKDGKFPWARAGIAMAVKRRAAQETPSQKISGRRENPTFRSKQGAALLRANGD